MKEGKREQPGVESPGVNPKVLGQIKDDLRDLYGSAKEPLAVLLQTMDSKEFTTVVPQKLASEARAKLEVLDYANEDEFVSAIVEIAAPILAITKEGKTDSYKQEGREMYSEQDVEFTADLIRSTKADRIYVTGNVGSGKTTFSRELSRNINYKNIDVDRYFQIFRQEQKREADNLSELLSYITSKEDPPYVINHADLLSQDLIREADVVVLLNPKKGSCLDRANYDMSRVLKVNGEW